MIESTNTWIDKQLWPDDVKDEAKQLHANRDSLNPFTLGQWISWAKNKGLVVIIGGSIFGQ